MESNDSEYEQYVEQKRLKVHGEQVNLPRLLEKIEVLENRIFCLERQVLCLESINIPIMGFGTFANFDCGGSRRV